MATFDKDVVESYGSLDAFAKADGCSRIYESDTHFHTVRKPGDEDAILSSRFVRNPRLVWELGRSKITNPARQTPVTIPTEREDFICSDCGAVVPENTNVCPNCHATFDDEESAKKPLQAKDSSPVKKLGVLKKIWSWIITVLGGIIVFFMIVALISTPYSRYSPAGMIQWFLFWIIFSAIGIMLIVKGRQIRKPSMTAAQKLRRVITNFSFMGLLVGFFAVGFIPTSNAENQSGNKATQTNLSAANLTQAPTRMVATKSTKPVATNLPTLPATTPMPTKQPAGPCVVLVDETKLSGSSPVGNPITINIDTEANRNTSTTMKAETTNYTYVGSIVNTVKMTINREVTYTASGNIYKITGTASGRMISNKNGVGYFYDASYDLIVTGGKFGTNPVACNK